MSDLLSYIAIAVLLLVAAVTAMAEAVISRVNKVKAYQLASERKGKNAERLLKIVEDPAPFLNVVLLITLLAHVSGTAIATDLAIERFEGNGAVIATLIMTTLIFVFAEVVPRTFVVQRTETAALLMAPFIYLLGRFLGPVGKLMITLANAMMILLPGRGLPKGPFVTEGEIRALVDVAEEEEEIEEEERELIHSVFEFGDTVVREVMVPRPDMVTVGATATLDQALETIIKKGYSRIPIYEGDTDNIVGVVYAKDLLKRIHQSKKEAKLTSIGRSPMFVPEQKKVAELLREMQSQRVHMAIVVDEYGGTAGLVTIEDLIEELVGEIVDEYDREEPLVEHVDANTVRVDARVPIDEINDLFETDLPHEEWDTVGGLVFGLLGRVPVAGEIVRFDSLELTTEAVRGRRVQRVLITKSAGAASSAR
ncbi:MAG TPA: hemolysin family protein [Actinomycetota bacterium]|nr:hemolysin family protein [Actinomycetota bacterium]